MERFTDSQTWLVVFDRAHGGMKWWHFLLHPSFRHIALWRDINGTAVCVNSLSHVMAIKEYPNSICDIVQQELKQNPTAILQYTVHYGSHYLAMPLEPLTCVSVAKRILGIRGPVTPKGLYHELIKAGAIALKPYCIY